MTSTTPRRTGRMALAAAAATALAWGASGTAGAHVSVSSPDAVAGGHAVVFISVPHGCGGSPTTGIAVQVPDGVTSVTPTRHGLYTLDVVTETLDEPVVDGHGNEVTERTSEVRWTAVEPLPEGQRDVFELSVRLADDAAGELHFPTVQTCEEGEVAWVQVPAEGQAADELEHPAPSLTVAEATGDQGHGDEAGGPDETITSGVPTALVVGSLVVGVLGLVTGAAALVQVRRRA